MAFAEVASKRASGMVNGDSGTLAFPGGGVTSGDICVIQGAMWASAGAPVTVTLTDTLGTTYSITYGTVIAGEKTFIGWGVAPSTGANTVTVNPAGSSSDFSYSIDAFTGTSPALDVNGGSTTGTSSSPADALTTLTENALILGVMTHDGSTQTITPGGSYTQIGEHESNTNMQCHNAVFRVATTAQAYTADWTTALGPLWAAQTLALKETVVGGIPFLVTAPYRPY